MKLLPPQQMEELDDREAYFKTLELVLSKQLVAAESFEAGIREVITDFRNAGHPLYSFDATDEWEIWIGNWTSPVKTTRLIIEFNPFTGVTLYWSVV